MKQRMEEAKSMIGNILGKFKKDKEQEEKEKENKGDIYLMNPQYEDNSQPPASNHMVGYSFSNNFMGVN